MMQKKLRARHTMTVNLRTISLVPRCKNMLSTKVFIFDMNVDLCKSASDVKHWGGNSFNAFNM